MSESKTPCKHGAITTWMTDDGMPTMWSCVACNHKFVPIAQLLQAEAERDALAARVAELEKDAGRWRFVRGKVSRILNERTLKMDGLRVEVYYDWPQAFLIVPTDNGALFDAAIDTAVAALSREEKP